LSFRGIAECDLAIVSPNDPGAMVQYANECRTLGVPFIFDPGQQCARMSGEELKEGALGATVLICNDYEFEIFKQKTELDQAAILAQIEVLVVTKGEHGSSIITREGTSDVPAVTPRRVVDPTGVGDGFRAGLLKGVSLGLPYPVAAQIGAVAATYVLEHLGGQSHAFTFTEFMARYEEHFPALTVQIRE
jgi:adenosine kinase